MPEEVSFRSCSFDEMNLLPTLCLSAPSYRQEKAGWRVRVSPKNKRRTHCARTCLRVTGTTVCLSPSSSFLVANQVISCKDRVRVRPKAHCERVKLVQADEERRKISKSMGWIPSLWTTAQAILSVAVLGVASTAGLLYRYQRSLVYPSNFPQGSRTDVLAPDHFGIPYEDIRLKTPDGESLHAFLMAQRTASEREKARGEDEEGNETIKRRPTILFLHANAGNMGHRLPLASVFYKRFGCNVFMLSYRGYGLSTGQPSEQGIRIDAQTALDWIRKHEALQKTVIVAYGQSIGGAVAVDLASRNAKSVSSKVLALSIPSLLFSRPEPVDLTHLCAPQIHALILENTFLSVPELIPHVLPPVRPFAFLCREYWPTGDSIRLIPRTTPVLFLSGRMDELVPPSHMDALLERCTSETKVWKSFAQGTHNDTCVKHGYFESIGLFLSNFIVPRTAGGAAAAAAAAAASPSLAAGFVLERDEKLGALRIIETPSSKEPGTASGNRSRSHSRSRSESSGSAGKLFRSASTGSSGSSGGGVRQRKAAAPTFQQRERTQDSDAEWVEMSAKDAETAGMP